MFRILVLLIVVLVVYIIGSGCPESHFNLFAKSESELEIDSVDSDLVTANTTFGFKLFDEIRKTEQDENIFISPLSVSVALAMTLNGAAGETEQSMIKALQLQGLGSKSINEGYAQLHQTLQAPDPEGALIIANSLWANQGIPFKQDFLQQNAHFFGAEISTLDFKDPSALQTINQWVNTHTNGKIPKILDEIKPETILFLVNTIYFKAAWKQKFDPWRTRYGTFHLITGEKKRVPMMTTDAWRSSYPYYRGDTFQAISLPYRDRTMSMYIFLPDRESNLNTFLERLNAERWEGWMSQFSRQNVQLVLPKFRFEYRVELNKALKALGMDITFNGEADFSRMAPPPPEGLFIDKMMHSSVIDVHEGGTEAAAATAVGPSVGAGHIEYVQFIADRPFFFAIRDKKTKTVLFMGVVMEPDDIPAVGIGKIDGIATSSDQDGISLQLESSKSVRYKSIVKPVYPEEARLAKKGGEVVIQLIVDENGMPKDIKPLTSIGYGLEEAAVEAIQKATFYPAMQGKIPVQQKVVIPYRFLYKPQKRKELE